GVRLICRGGGDVNSWERTVTFGAGRWDLADTDPHAPLEAELVYSAADGHLTVQAEHAGERFAVAGWLPRPLARANARLEVGVWSWQPHHYSRVELQELVVQAPPHELEVAAGGPPDADAAAALRAFAAGDRAQAEPLLARAAAR